MVTPVENAIRHVRLCSEIERFDDANKAVIARLLSSDDRAMENILEELRQIRSLAGNASSAISARVTRAEEIMNETRLLKATMIERLKPKASQKNVSMLRPMKSQIVKEPVVKLAPALWAKKPAANKSKKVVELFAAT